MVLSTITSSERSNNNNNSEDDDWDGGNHQGENKLKQLGETEGFELVYTYTSSEEGVTNVEVTVGMKNHVVWINSDEQFQAYRLNDDQTVSMSIADESGDGYTWMNLGDSVNFEQMEDATIGYFYIADEYSSVLRKQRDTTFLGRPAAVYYFEGNIEGNVTLEAIIDKELGMVMRWEAHSGIDFLFEITSFKTGNQVNIPEIAEE